MPKSRKSAKRQNRKHWNPWSARVNNAYSVKMVTLSNMRQAPSIVWPSYLNPRPIGAGDLTGNRKWK